MATGLIAAEAEAILNANLRLTYVWVKLHVGDPGAAATLDPAAETERAQVTWAVASGPTMLSDSAASWVGVAGSEDYTHFSAWDSQTVGTCGFTGIVTATPVTSGDNFSIPAGQLSATFPVATDPA